MTHCPKDKSPLSLDAGYLVCAGGHAFKPQMPATDSGQAKTGTKGGKGKEGGKARKPTASEAEIQASILEWLRFKGIPHTRSEARQSFNENGQQVRRLNPGWPDITACWRGTLLAIECKSEKGKLRQEQARVLDQLWRAGAVVVIARSIDDVSQAVEHGTPDETKREITQALNTSPCIA